MPTSNTHTHHTPHTHKSNTYSVTLTIRALEKEILASGGTVCILTSRGGNPANTNLNIEPHPNRQILFMDNDIECWFQPEYRIGVALSKRTMQQMDQFHPTVVHVTAPDITCIHVEAYAIQRELPLVGSYHSNLMDYLSFYPGNKVVIPLMNEFFNHSYNFMMKLYVPTQATKEHLNVESITDVKVWGRGVDTTIFTPTFRSKTFRQKIGVSDSCPIVLFVGRLVKEKGIDVVVEVIKRLTSVNVDFHAVIVGEGTFDKHFIGEPNTTLLGWLDGKDLSEAYASSDVFLFPSTVETFGVVTLEAAASGLAIVCASSCSSHLVQDGINGYLCDDGDVDAFYEATLKLVQHPTLRESFSEASIQIGQSKSKVVAMRQMLQNYIDVQDQFKNEFNGRHYNHLKSKEHWAGTFHLGVNPIPHGWFIVENGAVFVLQLLNFLSHQVLRKLWRDRGTVVNVQKKKVDTSKGSVASKLLVSVGDSRLLVSGVLTFIYVGSFFYRCVNSFRFASGALWKEAGDGLSRRKSN